MQSDVSDSFDSAEAATGSSAEWRGGKGADLEHSGSLHARYGRHQKLSILAALKPRHTCLREPTRQSALFCMPDIICQHYSESRHCKTHWRLQGQSARRRPHNAGDLPRKHDFSTAKSLRTVYFIRLHCCTSLIIVKFMTWIFLCCFGLRQLSVQEQYRYMPSTIVSQQVRHEVLRYDRDWQQHAMWT